MEVCITNSLSRSAGVKTSDAQGYPIDQLQQQDELLFWNKGDEGKQMLILMHSNFEQFICQWRSLVLV